MRGLRHEIRQESPFRSPEEEAYLNLQRTANILLQGLTRLLRDRAPGTAGMTPSQYNVLRILRGSHPDALTCGEIGERLVTPGPDVTRLLDRLEQQAWVERERDVVDRRVVRSRITEQGLGVLADLDGAVDRWLHEQLGHLGGEDLGALSELMVRARTPSDGH
ncbi:MAG: MarR family transcriptional regulator [Thermoanaerobaculia bacterium]|nr:MarR family transcriptional regulator [Thermoanaerobaculia bacterium]